MGGQVPVDLRPFGRRPGSFRAARIFRAVYSRSRVGDQPLESGLRTQVFQMRIDLEERPAGIAGIDAALQPRHRLFRFAQYGVNAGDMMVGMVRMAEGEWKIERLPNTFERGAGLVAAGVQHALQADEQGLVGVSFQSHRQPMLGHIQVSDQQQAVRATPEAFVLPGASLNQASPASSPARSLHDQQR